MRCDYSTLMEFLEEHNILTLREYDEKERINAFTVIEGKCINENCDTFFRKEFRSLLKTNGYCFECTKNIAKIKLKQNCFEKYGVEHTSKLVHVKEKVKQTSLERYGTECSLHNKEVNEKTKNTCLEKYGVEHHSQVKEIREKANETCLQKYGVESYSQTQEFREKTKNTSLEKYGIEHHSQSQHFRDQYKSTCLEKYGVESYSQSELFKDQFKETFLTKYGVDSPFKVKEIYEKGKQTCLKKYGAEFYNQTQEHKIRAKKTSLEKYGVEHSSQNHEIMEKIIKNAYRRKDFIFPSGKTEKVQGAEPYALKYLIENEHLHENDIVVGCKNVPSIWYEDSNGKKRRHYVDIFIPSQNKCIEVKSNWTAKINLDTIFLKQKAGKELGFQYEIWIYNGRGKFLEKHL